MSNKKKISLSIVLLGISAVIFGSYAITGVSSGMDKVKGTHEREAIDFAQSVIQSVQNGRAREFIAGSANPGERGLKECYESLRGISPAADPQWEVKKAREDEVFHVYFTAGGGGKVVMMLKYVDKQWKFLYVTQG